MVKGLNKFERKEKRQQRRQYQQNHLKSDLITPKYRERTIPNKRREDEYDDAEWT